MIIIHYEEDFYNGHGVYPEERRIEFNTLEEAKEWLIEEECQNSLSGHKAIRGRDTTRGFEIFEATEIEQDNIFTPEELEEAIIKYKQKLDTFIEEQEQKNMSEQEKKEREEYKRLQNIYG